MHKSDQIGQLVAAVAKARPAYKVIGKDKTAKIQSAKGAFSYTYADLATAIDATSAALAANGLTVLQPARLEGGHIVVTTILAHSSGEWLSEEMSWPVADTDNRSIGSGLTYARRHSYLAIIGAAAQDEDDDAQAARGGDHETEKPQSRTATVAGKVAAANGKPADPARQILGEAIIVFGDEAKAREFLRHERSDRVGTPITDAELVALRAALETRRQQQKNVNDAASILGAH